MAFERFIIEYPEALHSVVDRPADYVAGNRRPPQAPVQARPEVSECSVADPKISAAANYIFGKLD